MPQICVLGCATTTGVRKHNFPNPTKFPELFKTWVHLVGGKLASTKDYNFYKTKRICDKHFRDDDKVRNNRLKYLTVPSLHLPEPSDAVTAEVVTLEEKMPESNSALINMQDVTSTPSGSDLLQFNLSEGATSPISDNMKLHKPDSTSSIYINNTSVMLGTTYDVLLDHNYCKTGTHCEVTMKSLATTSKQTKFTVQDASSSNKFNNLRREIFRLRKRSKTFKLKLANAEKISEKSAFKKLTQHMTKPAKIFTKMQYTQTQKKAAGRRFNLEEKILSLSFYKRSPKCYTLLSKCFTLPSAKSLKRLLGEVKLTSGINEVIFKKIKKTVREMNPEDRLCTLIFDEMSLTPQINFDESQDEFRGFSTHGKQKFADHVLTFMVKGIKANFKQPVAYFFTSNLDKLEIKKLISEVIIHVQNAGLTVLCTVCDQCTINVSAINELINETKAEYLRGRKQWKNDFFEIKNKKIIPLYDIPHLLKGIRNNILTKDLKYVDPDDGNKEKIVKWEYFQLLYTADKSYGELRYLNKITEEHVDPSKIKKMRVKTAAQILSHSVAVATEHLSERGNIPLECKQLIPFVLLIDKLFDSLNCNTFHIPNGKIYKGPVRHQSPHHELWVKAIKIMKTVKFISKKKDDNSIRLVESTVPSINNFIKTIEGIQALWKILSQKYSFDCMLTRHFNQDPIENFFGNIRSYGARNIAPNTVAFEGAFKSLLLNNFNSPHSLNANCEEDKNYCLQSLDFFIKEKLDAPATTSNVSKENLTLDMAIINGNKHSPDSGQSNYVCGWVLKKCLVKVKGCKACKQFLLGDQNHVSNAFIKAKEYYHDKKWLVYPSEDIQTCFRDLQYIVVSVLEKDVPTVIQ